MEAFHSPEEMGHHCTFFPKIRGACCVPVCHSGVLPHKFLIRTWKDSPEFVLHLCPPVCAKGVLPGNGFFKFLASGQQDRNLTCAAKRAKAGLPHKGPASEPPELCTPHGCPAMSTGNSGLLEACPFLALLQRSLWPQPLPKGRQRRALRCWDL